MASTGFEFGEHQGLGWLGGKVRCLEAATLPLPRVGRNDVGIDSDFCMAPTEHAQLVAECKVGHRAIGSGRIRSSDAEQFYKVFRSKLYVVEDISAGTPLTPRNLRAIQAGTGARRVTYQGGHGQTRCARFRPWDTF